MNNIERIQSDPEVCFGGGGTMVGVTVDEGVGVAIVGVGDGVNVAVDVGTMTVITAASPSEMFSAS
jgi:hypothetical protein